MEYKLLQNSDSEELSKEVTEYLRDGWELHGQTRAVIAGNGSGMYGRDFELNFSQAVVKGYE